QDHKPGNKGDHREDILQGEEHISEIPHGLHGIVPGKKGLGKAILVEGHPEEDHHEKQVCRLWRDFPGPVFIYFCFSRFSEMLY
ncbi:MAG: hypothetical protein R6U41_13905, partial [Desulfosalsimonas sp.]|uniref:hypothetical protein n=1 Tax=Desulfosalsimonas sp. TaxID=3073848 RepID=UPI003970F33E